MVSLWKVEYLFNTNLWLLNGDKPSDFCIFFLPSCSKLVSKHKQKLKKKKIELTQFFKIYLILEALVLSVQSLGWLMQFVSGPSSCHAMQLLML